MLLFGLDIGSQRRWSSTGTKFEMELEMELEEMKFKMKFKTSLKSIHERMVNAR